MKSRELSALVFFLSSLAICFGSHVSFQTNETPQYNPSGLDRILKSIYTPESLSNGQNSGSITNSNGQDSEIRKQRDYDSSYNTGYPYYGIEYNPNNHKGTSSYSNGYQNIPSNNGNGYHYENPSELRNKYQSDSHNLANNKNLVYHSGYQMPMGTKLTDTVEESYTGISQGQFSSNGYHYDVPTQNFYDSYDTPNQSYKHVPDISTSYKSYQYGQNHDFRATANDGYQYERPKYSGYNYQKPPQAGQTESSFKGQSYFPSISSYLKESSIQGYSYEKPSTAFKGKPYLPLPAVS